jgi:hypothetical protein
MCVLRLCLVCIKAVQYVSIHHGVLPIRELGCSLHRLSRKLRLEMLE